MEHSLQVVQQSIYGDDGPPMFAHSSSKARAHHRADRRKLMMSSKPFTLPPIKPVNELRGPETLVACHLPDGFPPELSFRALAAYALLRTLSRELRLSPFTPNVFLRALNLPYPSRLLGQVHVNLLRILLPRLNLGYGYRTQGGSIGVFKKRRLDGIRWPLIGGDNLTYLDNYTWPLFYDDYCHLTADVLWVSMNDTNLYVDLRQIGEPVENSDDELEKDEDSVEPETNGLPETLEKSRKGNGHEKTAPITEPLQDSDDEYRGDEDDATIGGENDDDYEALIFQSKKRRRAAPRQALPRKLLRSTKSSPQHLQPTASSYPQDPTYKSNVSTSSRASKPQCSSMAPFTLQSLTFDSTQRTVAVNGTSAPVENIVVSEVEVISGSPLSQAVNYGTAQREASATPYEVGCRVSAMASVKEDCNAKPAFDMHNRDLVLEGGRWENSLDRLLDSSKEMTSVPNVLASSVTPDLLFVGGQALSEAKSDAAQIVATNKRQLGRFALPLNRPRSQVAGSFPTSFAAKVSPHGQACAEASGPHPRFSVRWDSSVSASAPFQHQQRPLLPSQGILPETRSFPLVGSRPFHGRTQDNGRCALSLAATTERKKRFVELRADIADELENAFMEGKFTPTDDSDTNFASCHSKGMEPGPAGVKEGSVADKDENDLGRWPQFKAIKRMRKGDPYHCLSLGEKLDMLEFLLDELLAIDFIAAEFTKRDAINGSHPFPYGCLPSQSELESLENEDECGVCGREGDLLCCDECTSSYHTLCLGMTQASRIPEGKWVCPECRIADPCKFGSLRGGKKSSVDWFSASDLLAAEKFKGETFSFPPSPPTLDSSLNFAYPYLERSTVNEKVNAITGGLASIPDGGTYIPSTGVDGIEFLIVGSFVFTRSRDGEVVEKLETAQPASILPLRQDKLADWLFKLGPAMGSMWPFAQIPQNPREIWNGKSLNASHIPSTLYFATLDSHDPSFYWSQYRKAPLPKSMKAGAGAQSASLSELENEFAAVDTNKLSGVLTRDMQFDGEIARELKCSVSLFDPYHVITSFLTRLEGSLRKAGLLDASWGTRNNDFKTDVWTTNVKRCRSIPRLAFLLVKLVDAMHLRCFVDEWHRVPGSSKNAENSSDNTALSLTARRFNLPKDWRAEAELRRRKWERCPIWAIRALIAKSSQDSVWNFTSSKQPSGRKRKHGVIPVKMEQSYSVFAKPLALPDATLRGDQASPINNNEFINRDNALLEKATFDPALNLELLAESQSSYHSGELESNADALFPIEEANGKSVRRRPDRVITRSGAWVSIDTTVAVDTDETPLSEMELLVESEHKKKLTELEKFARTPSSREANWPLAGRKLFEPAGYMPPIEMRRLARKAGAAAAPFVTYSAAHEVGQTALSHRWRKLTLECNSYEVLLLRIKSLESFLELSTIAAGDTLMRRTTSSKKQQNLNIIGCSHRDLQTGVTEYFVLDKDRKRGCWVSLANMELAPIVLDCGDQIESKLKELESRKKVKMEQQRTAKLAASIASAVLHVDAFADPKSRHIDDTCSEVVGRAPKRKKRESSDRVASSSASDVRIQQWNQEVEAAVLQHQLETRQLIVDRAKQGLSLLPPESQMHELRLQRVRYLKTPLEALRRCGESTALEAEVVARLTQAEIDALKMLKRTQLAQESSTESVPSWPLSTASQVPSLASSYGVGAEAMIRASFGSGNFEATVRPMTEHISSAPNSMSSFSHPTGNDFDPTGRNRASSTALNLTPAMLPYFQSMPPSLPPSSHSYHQNAGTPYHNIPMNVVRDMWSQNNAMNPNQARAHSPYGPGSNPHFVNSNVTQGMSNGYPHFRDSSGFVNHHPYSQPAVQNPTVDNFYSPHNNQNSYLPSYSLNPMGSMPTATNELSYRSNLVPTSRPTQHFPQASSSPDDTPIGFDLEPRPIEEMSRNAQDLESLLRRLNRYSR